MARTRTTKQPDGSHHTQAVPQDQWQFLLRDAHVGYITWEEYEANLHQLQQNRPAYGEDRRHGPAAGRTRLAPGTGHLWAVWQSDDAALLSAQAAEYACIRNICVRKSRSSRLETSLCQQVLGAGLDAAITDLLLAQLTPLAIETSLQVYEELHAQAAGGVAVACPTGRACPAHAAELAQRRFLRVDPENRSSR